MKIVVNGWYGNSNLGDEVLLVTMLKLINNKFDNADFTICSLNPKYTKEMLESYDLSVDILDKSKKNTQFTKQFYKIMISSDLYIYGGGSAFRDFENANPILTHLKLTLIAWLCQTKVIYLSIGVGPIWKLKSKVSMFLISIFSKIFVRDKRSKELLSKICLKKFDIINDLCFYNQDILTSHNIKKNKYKNSIGFALRYWDLRESNLSGIIDFKSIITEFINETNYENYIFFIMESGNHIPKNDKDFLLDLNIEKSKNVRLVNLDISGSLEKIFNDFSKVEILVGMRLHALIIGSMIKLPLISIEYDPKINALMTELNLEEFNINLTNLSSHLLIKKIKDVKKQTYSLNQIFENLESSKNLFFRELMTYDYKN